MVVTQLIRLKSRMKAVCACPHRLLLEALITQQVMLPCWVMQTAGAQLYICAATCYGTLIVMYYHVTSCIMQ